MAGNGQSAQFGQARLLPDRVDPHAALGLGRVEPVARQAHVTDVASSGPDAHRSEIVAEPDRSQTGRAARDPGDILLHGHGVDLPVRTIDQEVGVLRRRFRQGAEDGWRVGFGHHGPHQAWCRHDVQPRVDAGGVDDAVGQGHAAHGIGMVSRGRRRERGMGDDGWLPHVPDVDDEQPVPGVRHDAMIAATRALHMSLEML